MEDTAIIVAIIGAIAVIIAALIKFRPKSTPPINTTQDTVHNYIQKDIDRLFTSVDNLYEEITKSHAEGDKIMGLITDIRVRIAKLEVRK